MCEEEASVRRSDCSDAPDALLKNLFWRVSGPSFVPTTIRYSLSKRYVHAPAHGTKQFNIDVQHKEKLMPHTNFIFLLVHVEQSYNVNLQLYPYLLFFLDGKTENYYRYQGCFCEAKSRLAYEHECNGCQSSIDCSKHVKNCIVLANNISC